MKKILALLFFTILLIKCSSDDIVPEEENPNGELSGTSLFSISLPNNYFLEDELSLELPKVILTDNEGEIIVQGDLNNGTSTELKSDFNVENENYDLTFFKTYSSDQRKTLVIQTFTDVSPYHYDIKERIELNPNGTNYNIYIRHEGNELEENYGPSHYYLSGDYYNFITLLKQIPENFYVSFKNQAENFTRYFWTENVNGETKDTIDLNETTIIENGTTINYPENKSLSVSLEGKVLNHPNLFSDLGNVTDINGNTKVTFYIPDNIFNQFKTTTFLSLNGFKSYWKMEITDKINPTYDFPELSIEILNRNFDEVLIHTPNKYSYFEFEFTYLTVSDNYINWSVYGTSKENIEYKLPNIFEEIKAVFPDFVPSDLLLQSAKLHKITGLESYSDFISTKIDYLSESKSLITKEEWFRRY